MKHATIAFQELAALPGLRSVALVEAGSGMVWQSGANSDEFDALSEAAVEFWRLHLRLGTRLGDLNGLRMINLTFSEYLLSIFPCDNALPLLLVVLSETSTKGGVVPVNWRVLGEHITRLKTRLAEATPGPI